MMEAEADWPERGGMEFGLDEISGLPETEMMISFTALLELPAPQAVELLVKEESTDEQQTTPPPFFPSDASLIDRASKFSVFAALNENSLESSIIPSATAGSMKQERLDSDSRSVLFTPAISDRNTNPSKRKHKEKQVGEPSRKSENAGSNDGSSEKLPYVHVRARRGQATDNHSLAERARREKINARMKLLQELVPGCNKISGTALVLDGIINHVQDLQRQVEFLSMRLAAVDPRIDFNLDHLIAAESAAAVESSCEDVFSPPIWPENEINLMTRHHQYRQQEFFHQPSSNFIIIPEEPLMSYGSMCISDSLHSQVN